MLYDAIKNNHGLKHDPFKALVSPRPIAWISTLGRNGVANLAPYSAYNMVSNNPHMVMFAGSMKQHSTKHAIETGEFVVNVVPARLLKAMNLTSTRIPEDESEFALAGLSEAPCEKVRAPRLAESPISLECTFHSATTLPTPANQGKPSVVVFGLVVCVHIDDDLITEEGRVDVTRIQPASRAGYFDYGLFDKSIELKRP